MLNGEAGLEALGAFPSRAASGLNQDIARERERNCVDSRYILDEEDIYLDRGLCVGMREQGKKNIY